MNETAHNQQTVNQRQLHAALATLRRRLEASAGPRESASQAARHVDAIDAPPALQQLAVIFDLSIFERDLLLLCAGAELDPAFAAAVAAAQGDPRRARPTAGLAMIILPEPHWSAFTPTGPLRHWRLIELGEAEPFAASPLQLDERILHFLVGAPTLDRRLHPLLTLFQPAGALPASHQALARHIAAIWRAERHPRPLVQLSGADSATRAAIAVAASAALSRHLYRMHAADIPTQPDEQETLARLWDREAALSGASLLIECDDHSAPNHALAGFLERIQGIMLLSASEPLPHGERAGVRLDVPALPRIEQREIWQTALGPRLERLNGSLDALLAQFSFAAGDIQAIGFAIAAETESHNGLDIEHTIWNACRVQARLRLAGLAQRIDSGAAWDDLVLPDEQLATLRQIAAHVRQRGRVYEQWGFSAKGPRGLGISALFAGVSGAGKTLAAEVLANHLRLDLYRIDLSAVVSKYIGETEKNLRRIFDAADAGGAILLFDEADALFGKRSEVKDSHDRYANIEVSYLLQRMEAYRGLAILTTNLKSALDPAFLRRIRFVVNFPFPDAPHRARIWQRIFPPETPTEMLDPALLARLNIAGGNIRNIALNAAFLAADAGEPVRMTHVLSAARSEYQKLEKPLTDTELRGWG